MSSAGLVAMFEARQHAWAARDASALAETYAEDATIATPMFANVSGRSAILDSYRSLFRSFGDWRLTNESPIVDGSRVAQPFSVTATHSGPFMGLDPTGRQFEIHGVLLFEVTADGLIAHERRIYDFTGLLIQVGVLKGRPAF